MLLPPVRCAHEEMAIGRALEGLLGDGAELLLVVGASAVLDRRDVGPQGIVRAGGEILHFGMPVDPGNLICLGRIGDRPALVLPGCARSPKLNGIDWVLHRLFAGLKVTPARHHENGRRRAAEGDRRAADAARKGVGPTAAWGGAAQCPDHRGGGAGRWALPADGAAQQAADRRQGRQADDRPRGGQRAVVQRAADPGGDRPHGGASGTRAGRASGAVCARGGLCRGAVGQPEGRHRRGAAGMLPPRWSAWATCRW